MRRFTFKESYKENKYGTQYYNIFDNHFNKIYLPDINVIYREALGIIIFLNELYTEEYERGFQDGQMNIKGKLNDLINMGERNNYV